MKRNTKGLFCAFLMVFPQLYFQAQTTLSCNPDSAFTSINTNFTPGICFIPKTTPGYTDFMGNGFRLNAIRSNIIESALNNSSNLSGCLSVLNNVKNDLITISSRCDKLILIFEKMPPWLSSSSNGSPASTPGWYVLNTKPPANWNTWQTVVDSIVSKIVNEFGISNAWFEIWNEPDLGSWTGTMQEYFTLYKRTYDGIKAANPNAKAGGPVCNAWSGNIYWKPAAGYVSNATGDSTLIGQLLDTAKACGKIPDFLSWHNFSIAHQEHGNAVSYIQQKLNALSLPPIPLLVSEWNAPSSLRDSPLATSFMVKSQLEISKLPIAHNSVASWQDFNSSTTEFHNDYGLITYGAIHKPAYYSMLLSEKLKGKECNISSVVPFDGKSSVNNDTVSVLISNYCPPAFAEAIYHTLFTGKTNLRQLDSAKFLNVATGNINPLDSIYKGFITLQGNGFLQTAIINSIPVYRHFDSISSGNRLYALKLEGYTSNYSGKMYIIDSTKNNMQFKYDSLRKSGFTQTGAINYILPIQKLIASPIAIPGGQYSFSLQPNAVCLLQIYIPGISNGVENKYLSRNTLRVYPNPASDYILSEGFESDTDNPVYQLYSSQGILIAELKAIENRMNISALPSGLYFIKMKTNPRYSGKFIKL